MIRPSLISTLFPYTTLFRSASQVLLLGRYLRLGIEGADPLLLILELQPKRHAIFGARRSRGMTLAGDRKSTRLNSSHTVISYAVFCLKKKRSVLVLVSVIVA